MPSKELLITPEELPILLAALGAALVDTPPEAQYLRGAYRALLERAAQAYRPGEDEDDDDGAD